MKPVHFLVPLVLVACGGGGRTAVPDVVPVPADNAAPPEGTHSGFLRELDERGSIVLDPAVMLSGEAAIDAAREDGQLPPEGQLPNDFYIDNDELDVIELSVRDDAAVELYDCTAACERRSITTRDFLTQKVTPFGGEHTLVEVDVEHGEVTGLREIYVP